MEGVDGVEKGGAQEREKLQRSLYTNSVCRSKGVKQQVEFKSCKQQLYRLPDRIIGARYQLYEGRDWATYPCPFNAGLVNLSYCY